MKHGLFRELKRRHVYRVAIAYGVVGWAVIEIATQLFPVFHMPNWAEQLVVFIVALGWPIAVILAWAFEITPDGMRRTEPADSPDARAPRQHRKVGRTLDYVIMGVLALALGLSLWHPWSRHPNATRVASTAPGKSIAVLPFENLSSDKNNQYFADGMQDLILTKLASISDLKVISRTSTMKYGSHPEDLTTVGKQLGVTTILEGSVQKAGDQVLINVQLIDAHSDSHIWADSYTRTLKNVFSVEGEVAQKIADTLKARLSPAETRRLAMTLSDDPAANDLYLQGDYFANRGGANNDTAAIKQAIALYKQAIAKAPDFAQARARLSIIENELAWYGGGGENTAPLYADALSHAERALKLAPDLADAHLALGYYYYYGKNDYAPALKAISAALALRPNDSEAMAGKGAVLRRQGKFHQAIGVYRAALALDPRNIGLVIRLGSVYMMASHYAEAEKAFQRALALDPTSVNAKENYALAIELRSGDLSKALAQLQGDASMLKYLRFQVLIYDRKYDQSLRVLQSMPDTPDVFDPRLGPRSLALANLYRLRGDPIKARAYYAKALPQARAQYAALAGSPIIVQAFALSNVAQAELGLGQTRAGSADLEKVLAIAEHNKDRYRSSSMWLKVGVAVQYAWNGHADKAVPLLSTALTTTGTGREYSPVMLWIDPYLDPIRKTPQFQTLLKKFAKYRPATLPSQAKD